MDMRHQDPLSRATADLRLTICVSNWLVSLPLRFLCTADYPTLDSGWGFIIFS